MGLSLLAKTQYFWKLCLSIDPSHDDGSIHSVLGLGSQPSFFKAPNGALNSSHMLGIHLKQKAMRKETATDCALTSAHMLGFHLKQEAMTKDTARHLMGLPLLAKTRCYRELCSFSDHDIAHSVALSRQR